MILDSSNNIFLAMQDALTFRLSEEHLARLNRPTRHGPTISLQGCGSDLAAFLMQKVGRKGAVVGGCFQILPPWTSETPSTDTNLLDQAGTTLLLPASCFLLFHLSLVISGDMGSSPSLA